MKNIKLMAALFICIVFSVFIPQSSFSSENLSLIRVGLTSLGKSGTFNISNNYITAESYNGNEFFTSSSGFTISAEGDSIILNGVNGIIGIYDKENFKISPSDNSFININGKKYRGKLGFNVSGGLLTAVNYIDIDEYLYGVVPAEIPSSWNSEALKAQAVAARTFTVKKLGLHDASGYDLCDSTHCQVYKGAEYEFETTNEAVDETTGKIIYYNNEPIEALYFSSSGGNTENSENVWGNMLPYLRGVPEINEKNASKWSRTFTKEDIESMLRNINTDIGSVLSMSTENSSETNRVQKLIITGTNGTKVIEKEAVKTFFAPIGGSLLSRMFVINQEYSDNNTSKNNSESNNIYVLGKEETVNIPLDEVYVMGSDGISENNVQNISMLDEDGIKVNSNTNTDLSNKNTAYNISVPEDTFILNGLGSGHGVGMSQNGANGMAELGYSYLDILKYYYSGVEIK